MFLARKVSAPLWGAENDVAGDLSGDIAKEVFTKKNNLSFWRCRDASEVHGAALAIITAPAATPEELWIVLVPEDQVAAVGAGFSETEGDTLVESLKSKHVNATNLSFGRLHSLAKRLAPLVRDIGQSCYLFTKPEVLELIFHAIENNQLQADRLSKPTKEALGGNLAHLLAKRRS